MSDEAAIEETIRAFLAATAEGRGAAGFVTGPFGRWLELVGQAIPGGPDDRGTLTVHRLEVARVEGGQAVADLDADIELERRQPGVGRYRQSLRIEGPVVLERVGEDWRLVDWTSNGRRALDGLFPDARGRQETGGVAFEVIAARVAASATLLAVRIDNATGRELRVRSASVSQTRARGPRRVGAATLGARPVPAGASSGILYAPRLTVKAGREVLVALELEGADEPVRLAVPVSLTGADPGPARPVPVELRVRRWVNYQTIGLAVLVAVVIGVGLTGAWTAAGVMALFLVALIGWSLRRAVRIVGARPPELVGPPLAAAGVLVVFGAFALVHG